MVLELVTLGLTKVIWVMASLFFSDSDNAAPLVRKEMRILQYLLWENIDTLNEKKGKWNDNKAEARFSRNYSPPLFMYTLLIFNH